MADVDVYPHTMPSAVPEDTGPDDLPVIGSPMAFLNAGIIQGATFEQPEAGLEPTTQPAEVAMTRNENATLAGRKYFLPPFGNNANP
jgi:hypothetical protein